MSAESKVSVGVACGVTVTRSLPMPKVPGSLPGGGEFWFVPWYEAILAIGGFLRVLRFPPSQHNGTVCSQLIVSNTFKISTICAWDAQDISIVRPQAATGDCNVLDALNSDSAVSLIVSRKRHRALSLMINLEILRVLKYCIIIIIIIMLHVIL